ncbi:MAG: tail fiber domain-containing protein, partial [Bacteroidota bacterium]
IYSVSANDRIRATEFNAISDKRIKKDITPADNLADQEILRRLRVCDYRHIDEVRTGSALKKGFIAQEVREVFPEAVISSRGFVPDIYDVPENYKVQAGQLLISMTGEHGLAAGDMVRLMLPEGQRDLQVATVLDGRSFLVSGWEGGRPEWVFVFGKQVEDFLQVDYDRIHTLNVSATKELIRQVEGAQSDTESVRRDIKGNKSRIDQLELRMRALEARVSN